MIHIDPLPGTPQYEPGTFNRLIEKAKHEAEIYRESKIVRITLSIKISDDSIKSF